MSIYFLRHIKTTANLENKISGCTEVDILADQTITINTKLPVYFDTVFCSPLTRCQSTISLLPNDWYGNVVYSECLIERNMGILEGMKKQDATIQYPTLFFEGKVDVNAQIPNGETLFNVATRLTPLSEHLKFSSESKNILICSHNQTLKVLFSLLKNIALDNAYWKRVNFKNGTLINIADIIDIN